MIQAKPTIIELDMGELEDVLRRAEERLDEKDYGLIKAVIESYAYVTELVGDKDTTIRRLRQMLFGAKTEKTSAVVGGLKDAERGFAPPETTAMPESSAATEAEARAKTDVEMPAEAQSEPIPRRRTGRMDTATTGPTPSLGRRRSRCVTSRSSRAIPARSAERARSTTRAVRAWWCGWWARRP